MAPRKVGRSSGTARNRLHGPSAPDGHVASSRSRSNEDAVNELFGTKSPSPAITTRPSPTSDSKVTEQITIKIEDGSDEDIRKVPSVREGNPDEGWLQEWSRLDLNSTVAGQVAFFDTCTRFNNSDAIYVEFFMTIQHTLLRAKAAAINISRDPIAKANLKSLQRYFEHFEDTSRCLLRSDLEKIKVFDYRQCRNVTDLEDIFKYNRTFLDYTRQMAFSLCLGKEWEVLSKFVKKCINLDRELGLFDKLISSVQELQPAKSSLLMGGPLSSDLLEMDYELTDDIWLQWIEGCISYFEYWTTDSKWTFPAENFIRHLSHYRLAMELFLKHKTISDEKKPALLNAVKKYMGQYRDYAATKLETNYARLKENVKKSDIYLTEARFWDLAEDIEVLMNEPPQGVKVEAWDAVVPSMLPHDKVVAAQKAINVLYKEFQTKAYPEDEVAYLWLLTWRNIKHILPYLLSPPNLDAIRQQAEGLPITIEARDLALPFVEKNLSQLLSIVQNDNDALYQKDIEHLVGDYCAHIDRYVQGKGNGQERIYEQFARLSSTKRVPFAYLVSLEVSLLKPELQPTNSSQMVGHRVVMRLNHIMQGPKDFKRWELDDSGTFRTYFPTPRWIEEQQSLLQQAAGFNYHDHRTPSSPSSSNPTQSPVAGTGAAGGDDGDSNDKRNHSSEEDGESSGSDEEVEMISPGGTKRMEKRKKVRTTTKSVSAETLTKAKLENLAELAKRSDSDSTDTRSGSQADDEFEEDDEIMSGLHSSPADSLDYHRRRLMALRVEHRSAVPNAQYPLPESAAPQRAAALQIARELADPGIFTEGPRPEDVQNYINPALRLPLAEEDTAGQQGMLCQKAGPFHVLRNGPKSFSDRVSLPIDKANSFTVQDAEPALIRRALNRLRTVFGSPFFGSSPRRSHARATPHIPESNAQRAQHELEAREATPPALKRQADNFSVRKSPPRNGRPQRSTHNIPSFTQSDPPDSMEHHRRRLEVWRGEESSAQSNAEDSGDDASDADPDLPSGGHNQSSNSDASGESSHHSAHAARENQTPSTNSSAKNPNQESQTPSTDSSGKNSNQQNESPGKDSNQENQAPTHSSQQVQGNADDWNSPSPPHQYDNNIYQGSPIRTPSTPTPLKGNNSQTSTERRLPALAPAGLRAGHSEQKRENVNASPAGPPADDGPNPRLRELNRWIAMEIANNNPDMRNAYQLHRELHRTQNINTLNCLFEMLRGGVEVDSFNNYVFERNITFGPEAHAPIRRGVPSTVRPPGTPPTQTDQFLPGWWGDDLFEGTREGINRPGAAWVEPPPEEGEGQIHNSSKSRSSKSGSGSGSLSHDSHWSPISPSPMRDENSIIIPWSNSEDRENRDPLLGHTPGSPRTGASNRAWGFRPNARTGMPEREFSININPENRPSTGPFDLGEPLLVQDPLNPDLLNPNPHFDPAILALISGGGRDDHGVIEIRVPPGWRISVGPNAARGRKEGAPSPSARSSSSSGSGPPGDQRVVIHGPDFVIHEDSPSESSARDGSNAPPTLGLIESPPHNQGDIVGTVEKDESQTSSQTHPSHQGSGSNKSQGVQSNMSQGSRSKKSQGSGSSKKSQSGSGSNSSHQSSGSNNAHHGRGSDTSQQGSGSNRSNHSSGSTKPQQGSGSNNSLSKSGSHSNSDSGSSPSGSKSGSHSETPSLSTKTAAANPAKAQTPTESSESETGEPWYLRWETSTVFALRDELLHRGIPLLGLRLKKQMIDRLRRDDDENGIGGVYHPDEEEEEEEKEEEEDDDEIVDEGKGSEKGSGRKKGSGKKGGKGKEGGEGNDKDTPAQPPVQSRVRTSLKRRVNPFMYDANAAMERAIKRRAKEE